MRRFCLCACVVCAGMIAMAAYSSGTTAYAQNPGPPPAAGDNSAAPATPASAGTEVMTRGPIHEAFAQPVNSGEVKPLVVPNKPPEAIEEVPPDVKPADENAIWIGGYWGWDDDRKDFDWVSGVWRVPPPGRALGCRLLVPGLRRLQLGGRILDAGGTAKGVVLSRAAGLVGTRPYQRSAVAQRRLDVRLLAMERHALRMAAGLLGRGTARLGLGAGFVLLEPARLGILQRVLGLPARPTRFDLRAGVFHQRGLSPAGLFLFARRW